MLTPRRDAVALRFAELLRDLERSQPSDTETALRDLTSSAASALPGATSASITVATRAGEVKSVAATDSVADKIDDIQRRTKQGPCLEAAWEQHMMRIRDVETEARWPEFCRETIQNTSVRSSLAFQLFRNREAMGALNFYGERVDAFDDDSVELGLILATHTAVAWNLLVRDEQFRSALASRDVIGQAKGMLMERFDIDAAGAFGLLRKLSQESNTPLVDLAEQVIRSRGQDDSAAG
ncbi:GAF and ANTAR domain-containing protein [Mycobacterium sp. C31M]